MDSKDWPSMGDVILVQDIPATDAQRELWRNRQPPTRKGKVVEVPREDGSGFLVIDTGGEYGGVNYAARDFGSRYTWKYADAQRNGTLAPGEADELLRKLRHAIQRNEGSRVAPHFRDFMETFARLDKALTNGAEHPSDWR